MGISLNEKIGQYEAKCKLLGIKPMILTKTVYGISAECADKKADRCVIPNFVTELHTNAFYGANIQEIVIPESVRYFGNWAFARCKNLRKVVINSKSPRLSNYIFHSCMRLQSVELPEGLDKIDEQAFYDCKNLASVHIPSTVTGIYSEAFCGCASLKEIRLPKGIKVVGMSAFYGCESLERIYLSKENNITSKCLDKYKDKIVMY